MADSDETFDEKISPSSSPLSSSEITTTLPPSKECEFAPIASKRSRQSRSNSLGRTISARSLSHIRSNNGYGVDDGDESNSDLAEGDAEAGAASGERPEKDPWEVRWDGGDSDRLNPRSMSHMRKWCVVVIVSLSSLCV